MFVEPRGLRPCMGHDHKIIMKEGTHAINYRPYRDGALQKGIIEMMTQEMLDFRVI